MVSKNSKKGSQTKQVVWEEKKEKTKKQILLVEITNQVFEKIKDDKELSEYQGMQVLDVVDYHGKRYLKLKRE